MKRRSVPSTVLLYMVFMSLFLIAPLHALASDLDDILTVASSVDAAASVSPVYQFYNALLGGYFYTISEDEKNALIQNPQWNWTLQGTAFYAYPSQASDTLPVYHFYNDTIKSYYLTISEGEKDSLLQNPQWGWTLRDIAFYAYNAQAPNTVPVYQFYNTALGGYLYSTSEEGKNEILQHPEWCWVLKGIAFYAYAPPPAPKGPLDTWNWRNPLPEVILLDRVAFANDIFFAFAKGEIFTSPDALEWTKRYRGVKEQTFTGVAYGNGTFVTVGTFGSILTSPDGKTWTARNTETTGDYQGVAYGNGVFVIAARCGITLTSPDGLHWTETSPATPCVGGEYNNVIFANGLFFALHRVSQFEYGMLTSPDGMTWTEQYRGSTINGVAYGSGTYVAVGNDGVILISADGRVWRAINNETTGQYGGIVYGNGVFVATASYGNVLVSPDGLNWTAHSAGTGASPGYLTGITFGKGIFAVAAATYDSQDSYITSGDGAAWTMRDMSQGPKAYLKSVAYGKGMFVAVGDGIIMTSPDGLTWTTRLADPEKYFKGVTYGNGLFVAVGDDITVRCLIATSPDGVNWSFPDLGANGDLLINSVVYGNNTFVAVGPGGLIVTSTDGKVWTPQTVPGPYEFPYDFAGITYANGIFVVVGARTLYSCYCPYSPPTVTSVILTSSDGTTWEERKPVPGSPEAVNETLTSVSYGNNTFVAVGGYITRGFYSYYTYPGVVLTSQDSITWTRTQSWPTAVLSSVTFGNGTFVAVGTENDLSGPLSAPGTGRILTSSDGVAWTERESGYWGYLYGVAFGNDSFVTVGDNGAILQSDPLK